MTLKSEQQEYLNEGIEWTVIDYFDNGIICDMIDERHIGMATKLRISNYEHIFIHFLSP